jgi:hypothetical protein
MALFSMSRGRPADAGYLFLANAGNHAIYQVDDLDGTPTLSNLVTGLNEPRGVALDRANGHLYFADHDVTSPFVEAIRRVNIDGTDLQPVVTGGQENFVSPALDMAGGHVYWTNVLGPTNPAGPTGQRANLNGTGETTLLNSTNGLVTPIGIALDLVSTTKKLYFTDLGTGAKSLRRSNLDGTGLQNVVTNMNLGRSLVFDSTATTLYWADSGDQEILKASVADLNGVTTDLDALKTEGKVAVLLDSSDGLVAPWGLALDEVGGKIYWSDPGATTGGTTQDGKLSRADLDGTNVQVLINTNSGLIEPLGIVFVPEPASLVLLGAGVLVLLGLGGRRRRARSPQD